MSDITSLAMFVLKCIGMSFTDLNLIAGITDGTTDMPAHHLMINIGYTIWVYSYYIPVFPT